jgi:hypothetical protein
MASQGCRQGDEGAIPDFQFRIICEMTTAWPVHNINGNKDTMA